MSGLCVLTTYSHDAWGKTTEATISGTISSPFRFTGREWGAHGTRERDKVHPRSSRLARSELGSNAAPQLDAELYYYRARYYNQDNGRFLSREGLKRQDQPWTTSFAYVANNPVNYVDPNGNDRFYAFGVGYVQTLWTSVPSETWHSCPEGYDAWKVYDMDPFKLCTETRQYCVSRCLTSCNSWYIYSMNDFGDRATKAQQCGRCCDCMQKVCAGQHGYCYTWDHNAGDFGRPGWPDHRTEWERFVEYYGNIVGKFCEGHCMLAPWQKSSWCMTYYRPNDEEENVCLGSECDFEGILFEWGLWSGGCEYAWFIKDTCNERWTHNNRRCENAFCY